MRCGKTLSYLNAYEDDELSRLRRSRVAVHLDSCSSCRRRLREIRRLNELLSDALPVPSMPEGMAARIMAEARRRGRQDLPGRSAFPVSVNLPAWLAGFSTPMRLAATAACLLAVVAGLLFDNGSLTGPRPGGAAKDLYGLEWFASAPPGSITSVYIVMSNEARSVEGGDWR